MATSVKDPSTEMSAPDGIHLDEMPDDAMFERLLSSQAKAIEAVRQAATSLQAAISAALDRLHQPDSRLIYCGAGTSGRIALLDAVELDPTFSWPRDRMHVLLAGGKSSLFEAQEGAEDDKGAAETSLSDLSLNQKDVLVGLAASGTTPFVVSALETANAAGCLTIGFANNDHTPVLERAKHSIFLGTGPEVLAGSTRLAAGSSQKIALNIFSTAIMTRLGRVYRGRMVDMRVTNTKLRSRAIRIVQELTGCSATQSEEALSLSNFNIKLAILIAHGVETATAEAALKAERGNLGSALICLDL